MSGCSRSGWVSLRSSGGHPVSPILYAALSRHGGWGAHCSASHVSLVQAPKTKGKGWFDLPSQTIDEDMKRELRLIRLRGAYDPKRFYKSFDTSKFPTYFQVEPPSPACEP